MSATPAPAAVVDLNADVGEGHDDAPLIALVSSANVACGAHAGDESTMRATVRLARAHRVAVGAHPGFADRDGFGRRVLTRELHAIADLVAYQVRSLARIAAEEGVALTHVKPHGALYNLAAVDALVARAIADAVAGVAPRARLVGLAGSCALGAARAAGLVALAEAFVDRGYLADGTLAPRDRPGAVVHDVEQAAARAVRLAREGTIEALDGTILHLAPDTLCLHGDTPDAATRAQAVRMALLTAGVRVVAPVTTPRPTPS